MDVHMDIHNSIHSNYAHCLLHEGSMRSAMKYKDG